MMETIQKNSFKEQSFKIREKKSDFDEMENFLYEAIFVPEFIPQPPREIIYQPRLQVYIKNFGQGTADFCFVAEVENKTVGACWSRIMNDYGHIDDQTPSIALSVLKNFRRRGIATALMKNLIDKLTAENFEKISLSVQKNNIIAVKLYQKLDFEIFHENELEYIMTLQL